MTASIPLLPLALVLGTAVASDISTRRIPNRLILAGLAAGIACNLWSVRGIGAAGALLGAASGLALMLPGYALRVLGAGDAKLMAAVGAFLGPLPVLGAVLLTFAAGGVLSLAAALRSHALPRVLANLRLIGWMIVSSRGSGLSLQDVPTTGRLPYAVAIAAGSTLQLWLADSGGWPFV